MADIKIAGTPRENSFNPAKTDATDSVNLLEYYFANYGISSGIYVDRSYSVRDPRFIIYFAKKCPYLQLTEETLNNEKYAESVLAYYAIVGNIDKVKEFLRNGVNSDEAILVSIVGDDLEMIKFFDSLDQVTSVSIQKSLKFSLSPDMKEYLKKYMPKTK